MSKTIVITDKVRKLFFAHFDPTRDEKVDDALRAVIQHAEKNYEKHLKRRGLLRGHERQHKPATGLGSKFDQPDIVDY